MGAQFMLLLRENPLGTLVVALALLWAIERVVVNFINRNKPTLKCECDGCEDLCEADEDE